MSCEIQPAHHNHQPTNRAPNEPAGPICARKKHILGQKWSFWGRTYRGTNKTIGTAIFVDRVSYHYTQANNFPIGHTPKKFPYLRYMSFLGAQAHFWKVARVLESTLSFGPRMTKLTPDFNFPKNINGDRRLLGFGKNWRRNGRFSKNKTTKILLKWPKIFVEVTPIFVTHSWVNWI